MKRLGVSNILFIVAMLLFPILYNLQEFAPSDLKLLGYKQSYSFFLWLGKAVVVLLTLLLWKLSVEKWNSKIQRIGFYVLLTYAFFEFYVVFPKPNGEAFSQVFYISVSIISTIVAALLWPRVRYYLRKSTIEKLEGENAFLLNRVLTSENTLQEIRTESIKRIGIAHAQQMELLNNCHSMKDVILYESMMQQKSDEILNELKSIKTKTLN